MKRTALAAGVAALLWCGAANASVTLDLSFADSDFNVSGGFNATFDDIPDGVTTFYDASTLGCHVTSATYVCSGAFLTNDIGGGSDDGIQINLDNLIDPSGSVGLIYSFSKLALVTPGSYANMNDTGGHGATLTVTSDVTTAPPTIPEPATWTMMLIGFFGLGSGLRRRRVAILAPAR
ncbi:PEP-CTERM sorting domain-containing protein [Phenylobacterium sp.]|uniref:PEP-CTERM sorting domain-containing protein n=1 Tax=Phenylobacterium sp. TaxID=1871053 RepID=UPI0035674AEB